MSLRITRASLIGLLTLGLALLASNPGLAQQCASSNTMTGGGVNSMTVQKVAHFTLGTGVTIAAACNVVASMNVAQCANRGTWIGAAMNSGGLNALFARGSGNPAGTCQVACGECAGGCTSADDTVTNTLCIITANASDGLPVELMDFAVESEEEAAKEVSDDSTQ